MAGKQRTDREPGQPAAGKAAMLGGAYVVGFVATAGYYVIRGFTGCEVRTPTGRCFDFELMIEALVFALIWPLHWLFEIIEAIAR